MCYVDRFRVKPHSKVHLGELDPDHTGHHKNKAVARKEMDRYNRRLPEPQVDLDAIRRQYHRAAHDAHQGR